MIGQSMRAQRGSALLIVFVFAAMVAIMLYAEMPVAVFESKREKEQLLIDRGNEYAHGVKLFVRKFGMYPASIDQLENTNRMRFLRNRYKDPFTGKDDWRLLHAGPGGMLTDSKVKPLGGLNAPGMAAATSSPLSSGFGSTATNASSGFGQSGFGSTSQSAADAVVVPPIPQRPPAISATGPGSTIGNANGDVAAAPAEGDQNPTEPLLTSGATEQAATMPAGEAAGQAGNTAPGPVAAGAVSAGQNGQAAQGAPAEPDVQTAMNTVRNMLNNRPPQALLAGSTPSTGSSGSNLGQINSGGIAGVASKAEGHSIKTVNDQSDYSLWEFYYDPTKDLTRAMPGTAQAGAPQGLGANGMNTGVQPQNSFGQTSPNQTTPAANQGTTSGPAFPANPSANPPQE